MLNRIIIKNVNSISSCDISFKKDKYKFLEENVKGNIVNPMAIYGHNGTGKTSVIKAMEQLVSLMIDPAAIIRPFIVNNFLFDKYNQSKTKDEELITGSIELFFTKKDIEYDYYIATSSINGVVKEYLKKDDIILFERTGKTYKYLDNKQNVQDISIVVPTLRSLASLVINDEDIQTVYTYISSFTVVTPSQINSLGFVKSRIFNNINFMDLLVNKSKDVKEILKGYNEFPIYNIIKKDNKVGLMNSNKYYIEIEGENFKGQLPFDFISEGMKKQSVVLSILLSIPDDGIVFIDELEYALHPTAISSFIEIIKKKNIQVFFSSHNTYILQLLRPDQVYFAKWQKGKSYYFRLSDVYPNIREINNMEKMYLSNLFDEVIKINE